jgi:hypothetical protein
MGAFLNGRDWETSPDGGNDERRKLQRDPWWKPAKECSPSNGTTILEQE